MTKNKKLLKDIIVICLLVVLLISSTVSLSLAYFTDTKDNSVVINPATMRTTLVTEELTPDDLIAGNIFQKNLNITFTGGFSIYFRTYAEITVEVYNESKNIERRTDLVKSLLVARCIQGEDNKFYYTYENGILKPQPISIETNTTGIKLSVNYTFKVDNIVNETMFEDSNFNYDDNLKATITYHIEYIQKEGFDEWSGFGNGVDTANLIYGKTTVNGTPSETTPATLTHIGELITEGNYSLFGASLSHVGKYAIQVEDKYAILDEPLRSTTNKDGSSTYADYIDVNNNIVVRQTMSLVVTSDIEGLGWTLYNQENNGTFAFFLSSNDIFGKYDNSKINNGGKCVQYHGISTHFIYDINAGSGSTTGFSTAFTAAPPYLCIRITGDRSIDVAKTWFDEQAVNGTPVEFILAYCVPKIEKLVLI